MSSDKKKNFAFISYNHKDVRWAKWLRRKLEWYKLPSEIHNEFEDSRYIRPVFRDRDELSSGVLNDELLEKLLASKYLIVICSHNSQDSQWVSDEVKAFIRMGREKYIIPFIIDGQPQRYTEGDASVAIPDECFPLSLRQWNCDNPEKCLLGISINDDGERDKHKALIRLISRMLDISFDTLWKRHEREKRQRITGYLTLLFSTLFLIYWLTVPIKLSVRLQRTDSVLPDMEGGIIRLGKLELHINNPDTVITFDNVPGYYRLKRVPLQVISNRFYLPLDSSTRLTAGIAQTVSLVLNRDDSFSEYSGTIYNDDLTIVTGAEVCIEGHKTTTDSKGHFQIRFEQKEQTQAKEIHITHKGYKDFTRRNEHPSKKLKYIIHKD